MKLILYLKNLTRQKYALKYLLSIYFINFLVLSKSNINLSETCNDGWDLCQSLSSCKAYSELVTIDYRNLQYCNRSERIVCCPQIRYKKPTILETRTKEERPYEKECKKWQQAIYSNCPPEGLISQGTNVEAKEFPHLALVGSYTDSKYDWYCGGSLISPRFVLTAAHCLFEENEPPNRIRLGEIDYTITTDKSLIQEFTIKNYTEHPEYKFSENYWDIALIELNGEATINEYVVPICLPHTNGSEHTRLYAAGWGNLGPTQLKATHLQKVSLERFEDQDCIRKIGIDADARPDGIRPTHQMCAGSYTDKRDTCQGDSGGPLFIEHTEHRCMFEIFGITSFGVGGCATKGSPGVYTRLLPYIDWIESIVWKDDD